VIDSVLECDGLCLAWVHSRSPPTPPPSLPGPRRCARLLQVVVNRLYGRDDLPVVLLAELQWCPRRRRAAAPCRRQHRPVDLRVVLRDVHGLARTPPWKQVRRQRSRRD
jgi:hypothetical protein